MCSDGPEITAEEYQEAVTVLKLELRRPRKTRNHAMMKELMEKTRRERQRWIEQECPLVWEVVETFPCIATSKCVSDVNIE